MVRLLDRSAAVDCGLEFVPTEIGAVYRFGLNRLAPITNLTFILQGLPIYKSHSYSSKPHIMHMDSARFYARLPDRDKLIDEAEAVKSIKATLKQEIEKRLIALNARCPNRILCCTLR